MCAFDVTLFGLFDQNGNEEWILSLGTDGGKGIPASPQ